jgi:hypothetical protein
MNIHLEDLVEGFAEQMFNKQANAAFDQGNHSLFPNITSQQKWKYIHDDNKLHLSDGNKVYSFGHSGMKEEEDFPLKREKELEQSEFDKHPAKKGLAQVHRADPGSIYFTLQEGTKNPTLHLKHQGGDDWKATPKKKKKKVGPVVQGNPEEVKTAMLNKIADLKKKSEVIPNAINSGYHALMTPGVRLPGLENSPWLDFLGKAGIGAGLGGAYHIGRQALFNTDEENAQENADKTTLLKRLGIPAAALGVGSAMQHNLFGNYYLDRQLGNKELHNLARTQ